MMTQSNLHKKTSTFFIHCLIVFTAVTNIACNEEEVALPIKLKWVPSEFSEYGANFFQITTSDNGELFAIGIVKGQYGVHKATNKGWETIIKLEWLKYQILDFTIFKQKAYFIMLEGAIRTLWRADGTIIEKVEYGRLVNDVEHLNGKLIVSGDLGDLPGESFGLAYSEDGLIFLPIMPVDVEFTTPVYSLTVANNKLYVRDGNNNLYEYDYNTFKKLPSNFGFTLIDPQGNFYVILSSPSAINQVSKFVGNEYVSIGEAFGEGIMLNDLFLKDGILIATGINSISITFFFDGNEWREVPTTNYFFGTFTFNNRVLAYTSYGVVAELVYD